jgi:hypothetical protein
MLWFWLWVFSLALSLDFAGVLELPPDAKFAVNERDTGNLVDSYAYVEARVSGEKMVQLGPQTSRGWDGGSGVVVGHRESMQSMSAQLFSVVILTAVKHIAVAHLPFATRFGISGHSLPWTQNCEF